MGEPPADAIRGARAARGNSSPRPMRGAGTCEFVAHGALAVQRRGGAPTREHLDHALQLDVDRLEIDICASRDGTLVVRHDDCLSDGRHVADLTLAELRADDPRLLTLDDVVEHLGSTIPLLIDLKAARAAPLLGGWFRGRHDLADYAVCTENIPWLLVLRFAAPRVARWPSFPDLGARSAHHVRMVAAGLWRTHASVSGLRRGVGDLQRAALQFPRSPSQSLAQIAGMPWRQRLPLDFAGPCSDLAAAGMCVQHWQISAELVERAHQAGMLVNTWTVNSPVVAAAVMDAGVDSVTTDRVGTLRLALDRPALAAG